MSPRSDIEREDTDKTQIIARRPKKWGLTNLQTETFQRMQTLVSQSSQTLDWRCNDCSSNCGDCEDCCLGARRRVVWRRFCGCFGAIGYFCLRGSRLVTATSSKTLTSLYQAVRGHNTVDSNFFFIFFFSTFLCNETNLR